LFVDVGEKKGADILAKLPAAKAASMVTAMAAKDIAGIFGYMEGKDAQKILTLLPSPKAAEVKAMTLPNMSADDLLQMNVKDAANAILAMSIDKAAAVFEDAAQKRRRLA